MPQYSESDRKAVINKYLKGKSIKWIAKEYKMSQRTVKALVELYELKGSVKPKPRPGRKSKGTKDTKRHLRNKAV